MPRKKKKTEPGSHPRTLPELVLLANKRKQNRTSAKTLQTAFYRSIYSYIYIYLYSSHCYQTTRKPTKTDVQRGKRKTQTNLQLINFLHRKKTQPQQSAVHFQHTERKQLKKNIGIPHLNVPSPLKKKGTGDCGSVLFDHFCALTNVEFELLETPVYVAYF